MRNNFDSPQTMLLSADTLESVGYAKSNHMKLTSEQLNLKLEQREKQRKNHENLEEQERLKADIYLENAIYKPENKLVRKDNLTEIVNQSYFSNTRAIEIALKYLERQNDFGIDVTESELKDKINIEIKKESEISTADKIKNYKYQLTQQGKLPTEILQTLISKFENEESISTWVSNWKNFLKLHQYAQTKSTVQQKAIQKIIAKADFTNQNAFTNTLSQISKSSEISTTTKLEIAQKFSNENVTTVVEMDNTLKQIQTRKKDLEKTINIKYVEKKSLKLEIENLENQLEKLPYHDPKREEIDVKLKEKKEALKDTENTIQTLEEESPKNVSFPLREGYTAKLNPNGTRTIEIDDLNFSLQLPENRLFMNQKNMLSINLVFAYRAFALNGMERIFTPNLENGAIPDKKNRLFGSRILKLLGYPTNQILSQTNIFQLQKDLSKLKQSGSSSTGMEDLKTLGIWDIAKQEVDNNRLNSCLWFIRKNRGRDVGFNELKGLR